MKLSKDVLVEKLLQKGYSGVCYDQAHVGVTYGICKEFTIHEMIHKLGLDKGESEFYNTGIFEYLPEIGIVQWYVDAATGLYEAFDTNTKESEHLINIMLENDL